MRTSNFTVEQISSALRRAEGGIAVAEICREHRYHEPALFQALFMYKVRDGLSIITMHPGPGS